MKKKGISKTENKNATLADGVFGASEETRLNGARLGTLPSIADTTCLSSEEKTLVENTLTKPAEGIEPSVARIPSLAPHHAAGTERAYQRHFYKAKIMLFFFFCLVVISSLCIFGLNPTSAQASGVLGSSNNQTSLTSGLVGYWPLDGSTINWSTGIVRDLSGQGNNGSLINMSTTTSPVAGKIGEALRFTGVAGKHVVVTGSDPLGVGVITVSAWIKPYSRGQAANGMIFSNGNTRAYMAGGAELSFTSNASTVVNSTLNSVPLNQWTHIVVTRDASGLATWYINGVINGAANRSSGTPLAGSTNFTIGDSPLAFNGIIDDVRVYSRILSAQEVQQLYTLGSANVAHSNTTSLTSGLVGYWPLDGGTTSWKTDTTQDVSGNGNTGQMIGMSTSTSPVQGKIGGALKFNGVSGYISIPADPLYQKSATSASFSFWSNVTPAALASTYHEAINNADDSTLYSSGYVAYFEGRTNANGTTGSNLFSVGLGVTGGNRLMATTAAIPSDGKWHQYAFTYTASTGTFYVDGNVVSSQVSSLSNNNKTGNLVPRNHAFNIGVSTNIAGVGGYFPSKLDDVRIYNRALSAQEVQQLYLLGK